MGASQKRRQEPKYKIGIKNEAKRLRATSFAIGKFEEQLFYGKQYRKIKNPVAFWVQKRYFFYYRFSKILAYFSL